MVMDTIQVRLNHSMVKIINEKVKNGLYSSKGEAVRDALRRTFIDWDKEVGTIKLKGNSVKLIREARKELSKQPINLDEINSLMD
jgi:Arc/MetJ-type ribon-helix-helix transcriptional regulator